MQNKDKIHLAVIIIFFQFFFHSSSFAQTVQLPPNNYYTKLNNGLSILVIEKHEVPLVTLSFVVKNGSFTESPEFNGLSHLYEHMFFKGNRVYLAEREYGFAMNKLGILHNAYTHNEHVYYFFEMQSRFLFQGMKLMNSGIRYPSFNFSEMKEENKVVDAEFQLHESNPNFILEDTMNHLLWGNLYSRKNVIGNHSVILSASPTKMRAIHERYYVPNNAMLIVSGDAKHESVFAMANIVFGKWEPSLEDIFATYPKPDFEALKENKEVILESENAKSPFLQIVWHGPSVKNDSISTYTADVFLKL